MIADIIPLALALVVLLLGAELFTNGIEWFGKRLELAEGAVGSVLAAVGTCLPETLIAISAILFARGQEASGVSIGAILGAPFMLATLAMFVTGVSVLAFARRRERGRRMQINAKLMSNDLMYFLIVFSLGVGASFLPHHEMKIGVGILLVALYVIYLKHTFSIEGDLGEDMHPLHFDRIRLRVVNGLRAVVAEDEDAPPDQPQHRVRFRLITSQVLAGLLLIMGGAYVFVHSLEGLAVSLGVSTLVLSAIITPVATELPEKFNSVTWVRRGKDTLALGNITGAMVFQSSVPVAIGLAFTPWLLDARAVSMSVLAVASSLVILLGLTIRGSLSPWALLTGGAFYAVFAVWVVG
jgi:cation:H+ antiporter